MTINLKNRSFLKLLDFTPGEIKSLLDLSFELKKAKYAGTEQKKLMGKEYSTYF
jgi:ornithine carbamoyltransferase